MDQTVERNRAALLKEFSRDFEIIGDSIDLGIAALESLCEESGSSHAPVTKAMAVAILTREVRRYQSIRSVAELGHSENVEILGRSMFEGLLSERFIFRKPLPWQKCSANLRHARKSLPRMPSQFSAVEFRSWLYASFESIRMGQIARVLREQGDTTTITDDVLDRLSSAAIDAEKTIGAKWSRLQRKKHSYSGLTIEQLAENCGLRDHYESIYRVQSTKTHANDPFAYIGMRREGDCFARLVHRIDESASLSNTLGLAAGLFNLLVNDLDEQFSLGLAERSMALARKTRKLVDNDTLERDSDGIRVDIGMFVS